ncbi:hypothetical protein Tco_0188076, partial [Tanacetum coccineum]
PLGRLEPPDLTVVQSHSGTAYHRPMPQHSKISESAGPEYPLSWHRYPGCPAPKLQQARVPINPYSTLLPPVGLRAAVKLSPTSYLDAGNGGSGDNGNGNDVGTGGGKCSDDGGGGSGGEGI